MTEHRSLEAYSLHAEASQKFDYFVAGVAIALVGYLGSRFEPQPIGWNARTIEMAAIVLLLVSAFCGLKRIETTVRLFAVQFSRLETSESAAAYNRAALGGRPGVDTVTGELVTPALAVERARPHAAGAEAAQGVLDRRATNSQRWYLVRDWLLVA